MRVMLVNQHFPPQFRGGSERSVQSLAMELSKLGDQVSIVARHPTPNPPMPLMVRERLPDDSRVYRLRGGEFDIERFMRHHRELEQTFTAAILDRQPEVVHFHHLRSLSPRFVEIAIKLGAAVVISLHDFYFACPRVHLQKPNDDLCAGPRGGHECASTCFADESNAISRWTTRADYYRQILSLAHRVVCYSEYVARYFAQYGVTESMLRMLPLGISPPDDSMPRSASDGQTLSIAFCGSVIRHKGPHVILDALKLAKLPSVKLKMLGEAPDQAYLTEMKLAAQSIAGLTLDFHGSYNWSDLSNLLERVDCVVSPSLVAETFGIVPREALVRGIPVVVSQLGALPEIVREGENGFTFDPRDPRELARLLSRMTNEPQLLPHLARGARLTFVESPRGHAVSVQAIYREAIEHSSRAGLNRDSTLIEIDEQYQKLLTLDFQ
jgi:glycosyltransferase involved in cell wall biosynthesis